MAGNRRGVALVHDPAPQGVALVGPDRVHRALLTVEGEGVGRPVRDPERSLEAGSEMLGVLRQSHGERGVAKSSRQPGHPNARVVRVGLDFDQGDRPVGDPAVPIADRVGRVLPAMLDQAAMCPAPILDEAVAVEVAVVLHPLERGKGIRPELLHEPEVAGPVIGLAEQDEPEGRHVSRPVVPAERYLAGPGHLTAAYLMRDLPRLRVSGRIVRGGLEGRQDPERIDGQAGVHEKRPEAGQDCIAAEQRREPGDASGQESLARAGPGRDEEVQVRDAPCHDPVERGIVGSDLRGVAQAICRLEGRAAAGAGGGLPWGSNHPDLQCRHHRDPLSRADARFKDIGQDRPCQRYPRTRLDPRAPTDSECRFGVGMRGLDSGPFGRHSRPERASVQAPVLEVGLALVHLDWANLTASGSDEPADLEDVGHVRVKEQIDGRTHGVVGVVRQGQPFMQAGGQPAFSDDPDGSGGGRPFLPWIPVRVGARIDVGEHDRPGGSVAGVGPQHLRPLAVHEQDEAREHAGVAQIQPEAVGVGHAVSSLVRQEEDGPAFQDAHDAGISGRDDRRRDVGKQERAIQGLWHVAEYSRARSPFVGRRCPALLACGGELAPTEVVQPCHTRHPRRERARRPLP